jgi:hypothetical protein
MIARAIVAGAVCALLALSTGVYAADGTAATGPWPTLATGVGVGVSLTALALVLAWRRRMLSGKAFDPSSFAVKAALVGMLLSFSALVFGAPACDWSKPNSDPFTGDVPDAVMTYADIPYVTRIKLRDRMMAHDYDDIATITRDSITGNYDYESSITAMHFGAGRICDTVSRAGWTADMREQGMVFCQDGHCVIRPSVCNNLSRITRVARPAMSLVPVPPVSALPPPLTIVPSLPPVVTATPIPVYDQNVLGYDPLPPRFIEINRPGHIDTGIRIVHVIPSPVPEPSTYALMLAGLGLVAWVARRRRK